MIAVVHEADDRLAMAETLADAFLDGPWRAEALAERGAGCLDHWPDWMDALAFSAAGKFLASQPPAQIRGARDVGFSALTEAKRKDGRRLRQPS